MLINNKFEAHKKRGDKKI